MTTPTEYTISTVLYSGDLMPDGDGYAPQIVLTHGGYGHWNITELCTETLPFSAEQFNEWRSELASRQLDLDTLARFIRICYGIEMIHTGTNGYSQGDWGYSFVFGTPEYYKLTGTDKVTDSDHNDLCAWIWGDVYEVTEVITPEVSHVETCNLGHEHTTVTTPEETCTTIIYGMSEAMKFANEHNIEIEGL